MSTKKKLIEATNNFLVAENYEESDSSLFMMRDYSELLKRKQSTPISVELLLKSGFKHFDYEIWTYNNDVFIQRIYGKWRVHREPSYIYVSSVADLEDALDLCGIDKEIEL